MNMEHLTKKNKNKFSNIPTRILAIVYLQAVSSKGKKVTVAVICLITERISSWMAFKDFSLGALGQTTYKAMHTCKNYNSVQRAGDLYKLSNFYLTGKRDDCKSYLLIYRKQALSQMRGISPT